MFDERFGRIGIVETLLAEQIKLWWSTDFCVNARVGPTPLLV